MTDCRTSLSEQTRTALEADVRANYNGLVGSVRNAMARRYGGRVPPGFEAEHWAQEAYRKALRQLDGLADEPAAHEEFLGRWTNRNYLTRVAINAATDAVGPADAPVSLDDDDAPEPPSTSESVEDGVIARLDRARQRTALAVVVRTLVWRAGTAGVTGVTAKQWATMQAFMTVRTVSVPDGEADNAALHSDTVRYLQRAREAWAKEQATKRAGGTVVHRDGLRTATARLLEVSPATVTSHIRATADAVKFTRYVAGVLAHRRALQHPACVAHHLNVADALAAAGYRAQQKLLSVAANHIHSTEQTGTRVDSISYGETGASTVDELHGAESVYADRAHAAWPNCVTVCADHTLNGRTNRTTEF